MGGRVPISGRAARQPIRDALLAQRETTYGHANLFLKDRLQLMGALEALNEMLLFGLTTAFLFAMIQRVWPLGGRERHQSP